MYPVEDYMMHHILFVHFRTDACRLHVNFCRSCICYMHILVAFSVFELELTVVDVGAMS